MRRPRNLPLLLLLAGAVLLALTAVIALVVTPRRKTATTTAAVRTTAPRRTTTAAPAPPETAMSWRSAGGLVWHADSIDPAVLGQAMRDAGFGWVAVQIADGATVTAPPADWIARFRAASGLAVGGWSVLRDDPAGEARLAAGLVAQDGLDFYVADAELEYAYTNGADRSPARFARSGAFVAAFRAAEPDLPAALSSYCRPDLNDLDWAAWARGGFDFLPQAYVGDLGAAGDPAVCVRAAEAFFPRTRIHPTLGVHPGQFGTPTPERYAALLEQARTTGFSVYPAENVDDRWQAFGTEIRSLGIAARVSP